MISFWTTALHYVLRGDEPDPTFAILRDPKGRGPNISLDLEKRPRSGKRGRIHLDLYAQDQKSEVARLILLGARQYPWRYEPNADYVVLADPDDNLFCVIEG